MGTDTPVRIGIGLPTLGGGDGSAGGRLDVVGAARHAEALGFDSAWVADLVVGDGTPALEATVALAAAAAATDRIRLGFGVLSLPLRPVAWVAAQVQSLQYVSGGRVLLGVGSGGLPGSPFWPAVGVPGRDRGRRTDAALAVLSRLVAGEPTELVDRPGRPVVTLGPATPVPPVLVGGKSSAARRRGRPGHRVARPGRGRRRLDAPVRPRRRGQGPTCRRYSSGSSGRRRVSDWNGKSGRSTVWKSTRVKVWATTRSRYSSVRKEK